MKPTEVFDYGRVIYDYITHNPLVTRGGLNSQYRTSSDDRRNQNLTWVLEALLAHEYIFKFTDKESSTVYFWSREHLRSPYTPDAKPTLDYEPVDVFGKRPVVPDPPVVKEEPKLPDEPMGDPIGLPPAAPKEPELDTSDIQAVMASQRDRLKGSLRDIYVVMMKRPCALFSKNDPELMALGHSMPDRARFLGRMFGLGAIRRLKDPSDKNVAYYTIYGECPVSLEEDKTELSHSARKQQAKLAVMVPPPAKKAESVQEQVPPKDEAAAEADLETAEAFEAELDETDDGDAPTIEPPMAFISNTGSVVMTRTDGTMDEFDLDESMALVELFLMTNHEVLSQRLNKMKAAQ